MRLTTKQTQIMDVVLKGNVNPDGVTTSWCDLQQIIERLPYETTRDSLIFSVRILAKRGLLERRHGAEVRRNRRRTIYVPANLAFDIFRSEIAKQLRFDSEEV